MAELQDNVRKYLEEVHFAVIGTVNQDGTPHQTALWYELRGNEIIMNTGKGTKKVRNLKRDPRASVCVPGQSKHVSIAGTVSFDEDDAHVLSDLTALAGRYAGKEAGPGIAQNIAKIPHVTLKLSIDRVSTFGQI
ncbi:MAG: PPOX class F420-dependent oxidoreductase [Chloroflexota bacterium]|nr:PPOX class F420-dependent oxidoreductase [Chloroflexota bacterium]